MHLAARVGVGTLNPGLAAVDIQSASHATAGEWLCSIALLVVPFVVTGAVFLRGSSLRGGIAGIIERPASGLETATGRPAWSSAGVQIGLWALITAAAGFFWDVAWHIDLGRDQQLFTPPHTLIAVGLLGLAVAGGVSALLATIQRAPVGLRVGPLHVPWGAAGLFVLGAFALIGFPLDQLWHSTYGVDVTMWSPTHLTMISGAAFAPLAVWLLYREGGPETGHRWVRRAAAPMLAGALVVALAAFQLEFDDGVPQWQMLWQPVLIALFATVALTTARVALGRGWALLTAIIFIGIRVVLTLIVSAGLHHVVTRFPLYLGIGACIELGFLLNRHRSLLTQAVSAGVLASTAGLATEWGWSHAWSYQPWQLRMLPAMWAAALAAIAGAVLGAAIGSVLGGGRARLPGRATVVAAAAALVCLAVPSPRDTAPVTATVNATPVTASVPTIDRYGRASFAQDVLVSVDVTPADGADNADVFRIVSWQGGGRIVAPLQEVSPGHWKTSVPVPTGGSWKAIVLLLKGDILAAAPVAMPDELEYNQAAIPLAHNQTSPMVPASSLLMRESHTGTMLPQVLAYGAYSLELLTALVVLSFGYVMVGRSAPASAAQLIGRRARPIRSPAAVR